MFLLALCITYHCFFVKLSSTKIASASEGVNFLTIVSLEAWSITLRNFLAQVGVEVITLINFAVFVFTEVRWLTLAAYVNYSTGTRSRNYFVIRCLLQSLSSLNDFNERPDFCLGSTDQLDSFIDDVSHWSLFFMKCPSL